MKNSHRLLFGRGWLLTGKFATLIFFLKKGGGKERIRKLPPKVCVSRVGRVSKSNKHDHTMEPSKKRESFLTQKNNHNRCSLSSTIHLSFLFPSDRYAWFFIHVQRQSLYSGGKEMSVETSRRGPDWGRSYRGERTGVLSAAGFPWSSPLPTSPRRSPFSATSLGREAEPQRRRS